VATERHPVDLRLGSRREHEPVKWKCSLGAASFQVCYLRTFADSREILAKAATAQHVVVVGSSFIGLEVAASLACSRNRS